MSDRRELRLLLGSAAILTPRQAAEMLPVADADALDWLEQHGLIRYMAGRKVVVWGDVVEAIRAADPRTIARPPSQSRGTLKRVKLGAK